MLEGITKDSVAVLAKERGIEIVEREITRSERFYADEFFMAGTAAEVTPIASLDGRAIGTGKTGLITKSPQKAFFGAMRGKDPKHSDWLDYVD